ncbi:MAG: hypothetical protein J7K00_04885 [Candidatus Diapherotrites archaeon]|nr:hypothetical protein [Candidatus Diapherotrites archaeon]
MIEIIAYLYAALGSLSLGYFVIRVGWPDIRANSPEYKLGLGMVMGFVFVVMGFFVSSIAAVVFHVPGAFDLFLPSVFFISIFVMLFLRFKRIRSSKTVVGVPINYAKAKTGKPLNKFVRQVKTAKTVKIAETPGKGMIPKTGVALSILSGFKKEAKDVSRGIFSVSGCFFDSVKSYAKRFALHKGKKKKDASEDDLGSAAFGWGKAGGKDNSVNAENDKVNVEELDDMIKSDFKKPPEDSIPHTVKPIDIEGLSKKLSEDRLKEEKEQKKKKAKLEKEELDEMALVILEELKEKSKLKHKTPEERRMERQKRLQSQTLSLQESDRQPAGEDKTAREEKHARSRRPKRHGRRGQESDRDSPAGKEEEVSGVKVDEASFDDLFSDSDTGLGTEKGSSDEGLLGGTEDDSGADSGLFAERFGEDSFESIDSLLTGDIDLESISKESGDNFESQFVEMKKSSGKKGCPNCGSAGTRVVFCSNCGSAMCSHCADGVDSEGNFVTFTCPKCREKTTVKKINEKLKL